LHISQHKLINEAKL